MSTVAMYKQDGKSCAITHYASIAEMEQDCLGSMVRAQNAGALAGVQQGQAPYNAQRWYGVESLAKVKAILAEGYPEGAALVDTLYDAIAPKLPRAVEFRRKVVRGDQGDVLDIHAVNRGALDKAWTTTKRRPNTGSGLIRIAVDICGNCDVGAEQLKWRGVAALALSRAMSKAGYSVEIVAGQSGTNAFQRHPELVGTTTVTVKPRYAVLDTATLAASICLPGFFRYLGFASIIRQADAMDCDVVGSLGRAVKLESVLPVPEKIAQVVVPETVNSHERAVAWVEEALAMLQGATVNKEREAA